MLQIIGPHVIMDTTPHVIMDTTQAEERGRRGAIKINILKCFFVSVGHPKKILATKAKVYPSLDLNTVFSDSH
jgi:hypothetical protein